MGKRERESDIEQRATGSNPTREDTDSVHGVLTQTGRPSRDGSVSLSTTLVRIETSQKLIDDWYEIV